MFENSLFNVTQQPVYVQDFEDNGSWAPRYLPVPKVKAIVNPQHQVLSVMSTDYVPIGGQQVLDKFLELFDEARIEVRPIKHHIERSKDGVLGRKEFMEVELPAYTLMPDTIEEQKLRIVIPNSYDGTLKLKMVIMMYRLVCSNGMMGWRSEFEFGFKHRTGAIDRLEDALNLYLLNQLEQTGNVMELLGNQNGRETEVMNYLNNNRILGGERWQEKLIGHWLTINRSTNLWDLYNLFTSEVTHNYGRNFSSKLQKLDALNNDVKHVWPKVLGVNNNFEDALLIAA